MPKSIKNRRLSITGALLAAVILMGGVSVHPSSALADDHGHGRDDHGHGPDRGHPPVRRGFDDHGWGQGRWMHGRHDGRDGYWWIAGGHWYYYQSPVYPYPASPYAPNVVYAPPVVVAPPPPPSPGINLVFPLNIR